MNKTSRLAAVWASLTLAMPSVTAADLSNPKVSGFVQVVYFHDESDLSSQTVGEDQTRSRFLVKRARPKLSGSINDKTKYVLLLGAESGTATLLDAFIDHQALPYLAVRAGQFKHPFGLEGLEAATQRPLIVLAEGTEKISKNLGETGRAFRDIGVQVGGDLRHDQLKGIRLSYAVAVVNGSGASPNKEHNDFKDLVCRLEISPASPVAVGGSVHIGRNDEEGSAYRKHEQSYALHADAGLFENNLHFRGEYFSAFYQNAVANNHDRNPLGWYLLAEAQVFPRITLQFRYEEWENNRLAHDGRLVTYTPGLSYEFSKAVSLKMNYLIREAGSAASAPGDTSTTKASGNKIGNLFAAQLQFIF